MVLSLWAVLLCLSGARAMRLIAEPLPELSPGEIEEYEHEQIQSLDLLSRAPLRQA